MSQLKASYHYQSDSFQPEHLKGYTLRLLMREGLLTYVVLNQEGLILTAKEYRGGSSAEPVALFQEVYQQDYFLKEAYSAVEVVSGSLSFSLIPNQFFVSGKAREFAGALVRETTAPGATPDHLAYSRMGQTGATAIFTFPLALKELCDQHLDQPTYIPSCQPLINMGAQLNAPGKDLLLLTLFAGQFVITSMKQGRLNLCNAYEYQSAADLVYFSQLVADITELNDGVDILLNGDIDPGGGLYRQLKDLVPRLQIPHQRLGMRFATPQEGFSAHRFAFLSY